MNIAFTALTLISLVLMTFTMPTDALPTMISGVTNAIVLILKLTAIYAVWMSVLKMMESTGLDRKLSRALRPIIKRLFKGESEKATTTSRSTSRPICWGWAGRPPPPR